MYPVSSRNDQDFLNLMDIYPDAVFHPAIYRLPEIFRQEGWCYEGEGEGLCYQGVVLNEMKGALADPGTVLEAEMNRLLFPDNCYCHVSGGDPEHIPDLSYEQFIASHRKYYHPSNARISLVGSVDLDAALKKIDGFLLGFDHREVNIDIPTQTPVPTVTNTVPYAVGAGEPLTEHTIISCGDPADGLLVEDQLNALAARLDTDYFVDLIRELPALVALTMVLGTMGTKRRSGKELQMLVKQKIGRLSFQPVVLPSSDADHCCVLVSAMAACLADRGESAVTLMTEILNETSFTDRKLLRDLLNQSAIRAQMALSSSGHVYAITHMGAYHTAHGIAREYTGGAELAAWFKRISTAADLLTLCEALDDIIADNAVCVVAGQSQMDGCGDRIASRRVL